MRPLWILKGLFWFQKHDISVDSFPFLWKHFILNQLSDIFHADVDLWAIRWWKWVYHKAAKKHTKKKKISNSTKSQSELWLQKKKDVHTGRQTEQGSPARQVLGLHGWCLVIKGCKDPLTDGAGHRVGDVSGRTERHTQHKFMCAFTCIISLFHMHPPTQASILHVSKWLHEKQTSKGTAVTEQGQESKSELKSRYRQAGSQSAGTKHSPQMICQSAF